MADILLLEPDYLNKYPPLGLMKISYFHKYIQRDFVRFAKGQLPDEFKGKKWDRVYVTTLFTFEWERTKKTLEYAVSVAKDPYQVYTGGILATLMPDLITEYFPTIKNNVGLLNRTGTLGLPGEECVDTLPPDYSILDDIADKYVYPAHDAYFTYMTRGCGMKCQFCAVQTLEPEYIPYLSITENIRLIDKQFGQKKDLLLMDNNVLRSPRFDEIIDEIIALGFGKGATYVNPVTQKKTQRFVDFNQGLDAFLLTPHKAKRLGELALRPARIAFDHIEDVDAYKRAIRLCAESGITHMSNYLLYNGDDFKGKGHNYHADTPEDLYNRMKISMDLCEELNSELDHKVFIFSFPMRYIPLSDLKRGYIGAKWNAKYLRALQRMLIPTQGKGVSSRSFFEADFGTTDSDFVKYLAMPEDHLGWRGHFVEKKESKSETAIRKIMWEENHKYISEWEKLYSKLGDDKDEFIAAIDDNNFCVERYLSLRTDLHKKLFIHYFTLPGLLKLLTGVVGTDKEYFVKNYISIEFPLMYKRLVNYVANGRVPHVALAGCCRIFGKQFVQDVFNLIDFNANDAPYVVNALKKIQSDLHENYFNFALLPIFFLFKQKGLFSLKKIKDLTKHIKDLDDVGLLCSLQEKFMQYNKLTIKQIKQENMGVEYALEKNFARLNEIKKALKL